MFQPGSTPHCLHSQHSQPARMELKGFFHLPKVGCALPSLPAAQMTLKMKRRGVKNPCMRSIIPVCLYLMSSNVPAMGHERRSREDPSDSLQWSCTLPTTSWGELLHGQHKKCDKYCSWNYLTTAPEDQTIPCQDRQGDASGLAQLSLLLPPLTGAPPSCCLLLLLPFSIPELNTKYQRVFQVWREES